jgi:choline-sulfatase
MYEEQDAHSQFWMRMIAMFSSITDVISRRAVYFVTSRYLDDKIGEVLQTLKDTRQTVSCVRPWRYAGWGSGSKMSFYDGSARTPIDCFVTRWNEVEPTPVSTIDIPRRRCGLAGELMY